MHTGGAGCQVSGRKPRSSSVRICASGTVSSSTSSLSTSVAVAVADQSRARHYRGTARDQMDPQDLDAGARAGRLLDTAPAARELARPLVPRSITLDVELDEHPGVAGGRYLTSRRFGSFFGSSSMRVGPLRGSEQVPTSDLNTGSVVALSGRDGRVHGQRSAGDLGRLPTLGPLRCCEPWEASSFSRGTTKCSNETAQGPLLHRWKASLP